MRFVSPMNRGWRFADRFEAAFLRAGMSLADWEPVELPHANRELPYNGFDEKDFQFVSTYAMDLALPPEVSAPGARTFADFEGVMVACEAWADGEPVGAHSGGYTPFSLELSVPARKAAAEGRSLRLVVKVDSTERPDTPPFGHVVDYLCYGGIYREATLRVVGPVAIADVHARPLCALADLKVLEAAVRLDLAHGAETAGLELRLALLDGGRLVAQTSRPIEAAALAGAGRAAAGQEMPATALPATALPATALPATAMTESAADGAFAEPGVAAATLRLEGLAGLRPWEPRDPALYEAVVELRRGGELLDRESRRIGFREAVWKPDGFHLNGRRLPLAGLNRHQAWPYAGYAMPARAQRRDAEILKRELACDIVRTSHYPQSRHFLDACDELGLLVFEELPGWQHIGDEAWKRSAERQLGEMIVRDRSRPSIVLWGVRINESADDGPFFRRTNGLARRLDADRATGGVRCFEGSELLEDVYTFNDFVHSGGKSALRRPRTVTKLRRDVPYLVSEHNGHMYPTKRFDQEERLVEHALRHLRVLDAAASLRGVAGAIGWCAFDYNTHKDFGSGDRICHHGVSDMFRIPKYAAAVYASRRPPEEGVVLEAATLFAKGERQAARLLPIHVFTNCDEVELHRRGERVGSFKPAREEYPGLARPPVVIRDLIGDRLERERFKPRDRAFVKRVAAKALEGGLEALSPFELLGLGFLLLKYRMSFAEAESLVNRYAIGWGASDESWELVGKVAGREVARRRHGGDARADRLSIRADGDRLEAAGSSWDCVRVELRLEDQYGNLCPFVPEAVDLEVEGPGRVIGPSRVALVGGCIAFWLRSTGERGAVSVRAKGTRFDSATLTIAAE